MLEFFSYDDDLPYYYQTKETNIQSSDISKLSKYFHP